MDFNRDCSYFDRIMDRLKNWGHMGWDEAQEFYRLKERWRERGFMWGDNQVLVHGDVTPTNILFGDGLWVIAIGWPARSSISSCSTPATRGWRSPLSGTSSGSMPAISPTGSAP
ncbi:MAG: hypothetical protein NTY64_00335 [Deltaproteobacteria bacterium]|nr:hypothetical protein [Deltaproteobacteria bacterium]